MKATDGDDRVRNPSRRAVLQWTAGLMVVGALPIQASSAQAAQEDEYLPEAAREEIDELARRLGSAEAVLLPEGTVIIDGWYLPAAYVQRIQHIAGSARG
jgi:hypothetical protein